MHRDLRQLQDGVFDILVVGGGASGAAIARESAQRGLATALIERDDLGGGTSAHCFKVVHGGIRYLQHMDIRRLRLSCRERATFLRIAPHLVEPLPFAVPTSGSGRNSKWFLGAGMLLYDALTADLNQAIPDPQRRIARTRFLSRHELLGSFPWMEAGDLSGAAVFEDGQMYNPPRLVLALAEAAAARGASVANYVGARRFLIEDRQVRGVLAQDRLTGDEFPIRARMVINAAGPWAESLLASLPGSGPGRLGAFSRDTCFVINRELPGRMAIAVQGRTRDADALLARGARHMFLVPWRNRTLVGVWHGVVPTDPDAANFPRAQLREYLDEISYCYPALGIREADVTMSGFGLVPFGEADAQGSGRLSFGKESRFIDHRQTDGLTGLVTCVSVRYTVARSDAEQALAMAARQMAIPPDTGLSHTDPVPGAAFSSFNALLAQLELHRPAWITPDTVLALARNHGSRAGAILQRAATQSPATAFLEGTRTLLAEIDHVIENEMAQTLADVLFRRTDTGSDQIPADAATQHALQYMAGRCNWSATRINDEHAGVQAHARRYLAAQG